MKIDEDKIRSIVEMQVREIIRDAFCVSKKLSYYAKRITRKDEAFFESVKKKQLSKAFSQTPQWEPILKRVNELGTIVLSLSSAVQKNEPPTRNQIYFWAMLQSLHEYIMRTRFIDIKPEVVQQLEMDMIMSYLRFAVDGMEIAAKEKKRLLKRMEALEIIAQGKLNEKHPARPLLTILEAAAACRVSERTIRRWEKFSKGESGGTPPPVWYLGRNVTAIELRKSRDIAEYNKSIATALRLENKKYWPLIEDRDRPVHM